MRKNKIKKIWNFLTYYLWRFFAIAIVAALGILLFVLLFISKIYLAISSQISPLQKLNRFCKKEWTSMFKNSSLLKALKWIVSRITAIDRSMRASPSLRSKITIAAMLIFIILFYPPTMWRNWKFYERGTASWYGPGFYMNRTASGEIFSPFGTMTAAHKKLPIGTIVLIKNLDNGKKAIARINDRGPYVGDRRIDISEALAKKLGIREKGLANVEIFIAD